jgi:hypothetical protein
MITDQSEYFGGTNSSALPGNSNKDAAKAQTVLLSRLFAALGR